MAIAEGTGGAGMKFLAPKIVNPPNPGVAKRKAEDQGGKPKSPIYPRPAFGGGAYMSDVLAAGGQLAPAAQGYTAPRIGAFETAPMPVVDNNPTDWGNKFIRGNKVYMTATINGVPGIYRMDFVAPVSSGGGTGGGGTGGYGGGGGGGSGNYGYSSPFSMGLINWRI